MGLVGVWRAGSYLEKIFAIELAHFLPLRVLAFLLRRVLRACKRGGILIRRWRLQPPTMRSGGRPAREHHQAMSSCASKVNITQGGGG